MNRPNQEFLTAAKALLGPSGWSEDADKLKEVASPWRGTNKGETPFLAMPASTEEAAGLVTVGGTRR